MPRIAEQVLPVTGGVDTHAGVHVAAAVDQVGRVLGTLWGSKTLPLVLSWAFRRPDPTPGRPGRVPLQNGEALPDLRVHGVVQAARWYSLITPPSIFRRRTGAPGGTTTGAS